MNRWSCVNRFDVFFVSLFTWIHFALFSCLYTSFRASEKKIEAIEFSEWIIIFLTNWLLFLMIYILTCVNMNMIKYYIFVFWKCLDFHTRVYISVCGCGDFFSLCAYSHLFRTIWIHITNFKRRKKTYSKMFELLGLEFYLYI